MSPLLRETVHELFGRAAERHGGEIALDCRERLVTYRELERLASGLAATLLGAGVGKGSVVAILCADTVGMVTAILAALKIGAVFVPLDPRVPAAALGGMIAVVSPGWFVVEPRLADLAADLAAGGELILLDCLERGCPGAGGEGLDTETPGPVAALPAVEHGGDDLCYVYFTSGSTGTPKGIAGRLKAIDHFIRWEIEALGLDAGVRVSHLSSPAFDASLRDFFVPLCAGGTLCVPDSPEMVMDGTRLADWLERCRVTLVHCVPSLLRALLDAGLTARRLPRLRHLLLAGEPLLPADVKRWTAVFGDRVQMVNLYGPSETTMTKLCYFVQPGDAERPSIPIGKPMRGAEVLVLDDRGRPCPPGIAGEIHIRTPFRSLGYFARPDLTRASFVPNPLTGDAQDVVYKTGDFGRILRDGNCEFLGRRDHQVKVRGVRVELGSVEEALRRHPSVRDVVVVDRQDQGGDRFLCAYLVTAEDTAVAALREHCAGLLPEAMVPSAYLVMDALPRTLTGKVDRRALPPPAAMARREETYTAPQTPLERRLAGLWTEVLGLERVGRDENFFHLGGHSLAAMRLLARIRSELAADIPLGGLFRSPTVAELAETVAALGKEAWSPSTGGAGSRVAPLARTEYGTAAPQSFAQQRLWFLHLLDPGSVAYNLSYAVRFVGDLAVAPLARAFAEVERRHEVLRSTFMTFGQSPVQRVAAPAPLALPLVDLSAVAPAQGAAATVRLAAEEAGRPFDLARGPLLRLTLLRLGAAEHVLLLCIHHIVFDAWSMAVLVREVATLYEACRRGEVSPLPELRVQYADFAIWQRAWLQGERLEEELRYWRQALAGLSVLELATDRPRPARQTARAGARPLLLPAELSLALGSLGRSAGATLFMTLLGCLAALLHRDSGADDVAVGSPIATRGSEELEELIGLLVNTLVLRTDCSGNPSFRELLGRVRTATLAAFAHQDLPFEKVVDELGPERDLGRTPLFQIMLVLENAPAEPLRLPGQRLELMETSVHVARFDLTLTCVETAGGIVGSLEYNRDLFDPPTIGRLASRFLTLASSVASDPERVLAELPLCSAAERHQMVQEWNDTGLDAGEDLCLHELCERRAGLCPDTVAVTGDGDELSYGELDRGAGHLAQRLRERGVGPETVVAVCVERCCALMVGLLGILKAGGAYLPLDPDDPGERLRWMLGDSGAKVLLVQRRLLSGMVERLGEAAAGMMLCIDDPAAPWSRPSLGAGARGAAPAPGPGRDLPSAAAPDNLAYLIYTSGSTGRPKGTMNTHRGIVNRLRWMQARYRLAADDRVLQKTPFTFDVSVWELFWPLLTGARLVMARPGGHRDPVYLLHTLAEQEITTVHFVPSMLQAFLVSVAGNAGARLESAGPPPSARRPAPRLPLLRRTVASGEALSCELQQQYYAAFAAPLENLYGPTEAAVDVSFWACDPSSPLPLVPIGRPVANTCLHLLDRRLQEVPIGVPGELHIGGVQVSRGYLGRPDLTAARFVPDPFAARLDGEAGARLYRTGDLARYLPDGSLEFRGRTDDQVKLRGFRIELGEVEAALTEHPGVRSAAVLLAGLQPAASGQPPAAPSLVAYFAARPEHPPSLAELRGFLRERLPSYMVPARYVMLPDLPLTASGKLDRRALPAPAPAPAGAAHGSPAARSPRESLLASIWCQVLGLAEVHLDDNFFELGGDSILSILVVARAKEVGLDLTPRQMFQHQTIRELAAVAASGRVAAEQGPVVGPVALTPIQSWFFEQELAAPHHFNHAAFLALSEPLAPGLLARAVATLVEHHDALRLRFSRAGASWRQENAGPDDAAVLAVFDLSALARPAVEAAHREIAAAAQASLDLAAGPLLRVLYFPSLPPGPGRLLVVVHHLAIDAVSWRILLEDLETVSRQLQRRAAPRLQPKTTSFQAWATRLHQLAHAPETESELAYWQETLSRGRERLRRDHPAGRNRRESARSLRVFLDAEEAQALLRTLPARYHTQINEPLITALALAFARELGSRCLLLDLEGHGREDLSGTDLTRTVGWFTTLFPVAVELGAEADPLDVLREVKRRLRQVPNRGLGYGLLRHLSRRTAEQLRQLPRAEVLFNYLGQIDQALAESSLFHPAAEHPGQTEDRWGERHYLFEINALVRAGRLEVVWTYSDSVHDHATVQALAEAFVGSLRLLVSLCRSRAAAACVPSDFPLAGLEEDGLEALLARLADLGPRAPGEAAEPDLEDVYPLTLLQESMLFHALAAPRSRAGFEQSSCILEGDLDAVSFARAWRQVMERHPVLRTAFLATGLERPLQVVLREVSLPVEQLDWREVDAGAHGQRLAEYLAADRERGLDPARAPLMRVALARISDHAHYFVWSHHHLLLDGWCSARLLGEVLALYEGFRGGCEPELPVSRPLRDYVAWLQRQDLTLAEAYWRRSLAGFSTPTPLAADRSAVASAGEAGEGGAGYRELQLAATVSAGWSAFGRRNQLTQGTLALAVWTLLLGRYSGRTDVVAGMAVSGRPADLPGAETILGMFINNLPVRVRAPAGELTLPWLRGFQEQLAEVRQFEYSSPGQVQAWSDVPWGRRLFESLVVFENYPAGASPVAGAGETLRARSFQSRLETAYPLTLVCFPGPPLTLRLHYDGRRFDATTVSRMLEHLGNLLRGLIVEPPSPLGALPLLSIAERHQLLAEQDRESDRWPERLGAELRWELARTAPDVLPPGGGESFYVLDRSLWPVPLGVAGELYLGGLRGGPREAVAAARFRPDPVSGEPGALLWASGQLARLLPQGGREWLGPAGRTLEMRGWRVEPGEIEAALRRHPAVRDCVVLARQDTRGEIQPVAYVAATRERLSTTDPLRVFLRRLLPEPMLPASMAVLAALPLDVDGRVDEGALLAAEPREIASERRFLPPRNPLELRLVGVWEKLFELRPIGVKDDFFELGGHSLLAMRLMAEIRDKLGRDLPLATLLQATTVERLADALCRSGAWSPGSPLVELQPGGAKPPFFCVHPAGGTVLCYAELAARLGSDQPFYALQAEGRDDERPPLRSIEEMAARYLAAIREVQPHGPYLLGGWSFGGVVAFEMAHQLGAAGERVALLALIDSFAPGTELPEVADADLLGNAVEDYLPAAWDELKQLGTLDEQIGYLVARAAREDILPPGFDVATVRRHVEIFRACGAAFRGYTPPPYPGQAVLLAAGNPVRAWQDPAEQAWRWAELVQGGLSICSVPGSHANLVKRPQVDGLAEQLGRQIAAAHAGSSLAASPPRMAQIEKAVTE
jgi:amino acid adenylation domain-containing protein/non-ribosomal peptide synthase protein (TIGR01720 family)